MGRFPNWRRTSFLVAALMTSPALAEQPDYNPPQIDGAKVARDIGTMRGNGLTNSAIRYVLALDGIEVPDTVLSGQRSVDDAIADGSLRQGTAPPTWTPPAMQPTPTPDLTPKGSSASDWSSKVTAPAIQQMRGVINSVTRPPNC